MANQDDPVESEKVPVAGRGRLSWFNRNGTGLQAIAALTTIPVSAVAAVFAFQAFKDQQQVNRDQITLNQTVRERYERRYASRVAFWIADDDTSASARPQSSSLVIVATVSVLNRSPVPLRDAAVFAIAQSGEAFFWHQQDLRPCEKVDVALLAHATTAGRLKDPGNRFVLSLVFRDPTRLWHMTNDGLFPLDGYGSYTQDFIWEGAESGSTLTGSPLIYSSLIRKRAEVTDCGESG
ncbi:hypothetical protein [Verrucosispora sp. WMMD1129]|uniref:hypothetical protein n=1 Tax=Verrucosispora sp. WMMD1129 TaxID=3016093 RepID=UPI00249C2D3B|nr:hypothetical protein [Verrucosispora sp. WMMD1129]WFE47735.1 hypothetical protein O7624_27085 [Verrucosispora sp. WMMD1129]